MPRGFLDTNVLVYAFAIDDRTPKAEILLGSGCVTGVQVLDEFANVARRKLGMEWDEVGEALRAIRALRHAVVPLDLDVHAEGLEIARRYSLAVFDALMVAAAPRSGCNTLWSEDMQDGLIVGSRLRIANPFAAT